jgi:hypothetical protein
MKLKFELVNGYGVLLNDSSIYLERKINKYFDYCKIKNENVEIQVKKC